MVQNLFKGRGLVSSAFSRLYCQDMKRNVQGEVQDEAGLVERRKGRLSLVLAGHPSLLSREGAPQGQQTVPPEQKHQPSWLPALFDQRQHISQQGELGGCVPETA